MILELTPEEGRLLHQLIGESIKQLGVEIHRTDHRDYRDFLQHRHDLLAAMEARLQPADAESNSP